MFEFIAYLLWGLLHLWVTFTPLLMLLIAAALLDENKKKRGKTK